MKRRADIVVVGGGMVGGVFAAAAADAGFDVVVLDAGPPPDAPIGDDYAPRVVALSRASEQLLRDTGAWAKLDQARVQAYQGMRVWDSAGAAFDDDALMFDASDVGEPNLGHIAENDALAAAAYEAAISKPSLSWFSDTPVSDIVVSERGARVQVQNGDSVSAALVVAADGARSQCRELLGVDVASGEYAQQAVVTHISTAQSHQATAWQRFLPNGPLALLPLADGRTSIVWSTTVDEAQRLLELDDTAFCARVQKASAGVLGDVTACTQRFSFPLRWLHVASYSGHRFAFMGDAAHVVHPLAGLGVNLGLLDAHALRDVVVAARAAKRDIGDAPVLRPYARQRKSDNALMLEALTGLHKLFSNESFPLSLVRRMGLRAVNQAAPLKRRFMRRAMGLGRR